MVYVLPHLILIEGLQYQPIKGFSFCYLAVIG